MFLPIDWRWNFWMDWRLHRCFLNHGYLVRSLYKFGHWGKASGKRLGSLTCRNWLRRYSVTGMQRSKYLSLCTDSYLIINTVSLALYLLPFSNIWKLGDTNMVHNSNCNYFYCIWAQHGHTTVVWTIVWSGDVHNALRVLFG